MKLERRNRVKAEGGMSSMTDLVFLLLIFFIIMSTMTKKTMAVDLPKSGGVSSQDGIVDVGVNESNEYFLEDDSEKTYNFEEIKPILVSKMDKVIEKNIKIHGDKNADYEFVFNLIALSKQNSWKPVLVYE